MDVHNPEQRSYNMSRIRSKNTKPEVLLRKALWNNGIRYSLHSKKLPGSPDIVITKHRIAVFVHGCFWHRHQGCKYTTTPETRKEFWEAKFSENIARDKRNYKALIEMKWKVLIVWECEVKNEFEKTINKVIDFIRETK